MQTTSRKHLGPRAVLGSERCQQLGKSEPELEEAGCSVHRQFVKQQQQQDGSRKEQALQSQLLAPRAAPQPGVPRSEQAYLTTSHDGLPQRLGEATTSLWSAGEGIYHFPGCHSR